MTTSVIVISNQNTERFYQHNYLEKNTCYTNEMFALWISCFVRNIRSRNLIKANWANFDRATKPRHCHATITLLFLSVCSDSQCVPINRFDAKSALFSSLVDNLFHLLYGIELQTITSTQTKYNTIKKLSTTTQNTQHSP